MWDGRQRAVVGFERINAGNVQFLILRSRPIESNANGYERVDEYDD